jgi:hypothetical protein
LPFCPFTLCPERSEGQKSFGEIADMASELKANYNFNTFMIFMVKKYSTMKNHEER